MVDRTHETAVVDGHRLHYVAAGAADAPTLLLLHGGIIDAAYVSWGAVIEPLGREYRVLAPDLLGYGRSAKPDVTYSLATHVDVVESFVDTVGLDSPAVAGISMGGGIAFGLALRSPDLVDRLVAIDSYGLGRELANGRLTALLSGTELPNRLAIAIMRRSRGFTKASLGNIVHDTDRLSADAVDAVWEETKRPGVGRAYRSFRAAEVTSDGYRTDFTDRLDDLDVPTCLLHGEHDEVFPHRWSERAAARIPDSEFRLLADCAHWAPRERPDVVVELISEFLPQ
ncbi:alpha/beta fold hydrolase [Halosimplex salinum]|uniref:alpha/beta fold hydrolase n=1 Tax=Halosimplex salinum TaxID=1710538 RepID=UPI000F4A69AF|nr:alpha/beta fold hydrolase [Halosimplex salinum]